MPTLHIKEITCKGFDGSLKFQPKLGDQKVGKAIEVDEPSDKKPVVIRFDTDDRLVLLKLDTKVTYEGRSLPTQKGENGEYVFKTPPQKTLKVRYTIEE